MPSNPHDSETFDGPPPGRIDIHSHMLPGVDDGCTNLDEVLTSIEQLKQVGFVGSICTPHIWVDGPHRSCTPVAIADWTGKLRAQLRGRGIDYELWPGGELRLFDGVIDWLKVNGIPSMAGSKYVLADFWETRWPRWVNRVFEWLLAEGYHPILAHPERLSIPTNLRQRLRELSSEGVLLQGNFRCLTGAEGLLAQTQIQQWLSEGCYSFLAVDMHRPDTLPSRLAGLSILEQDRGPNFIDDLTRTSPRELIFGL